MMNLKTKRAFSFIEIFVVIAIVIFLFALAFTFLVNARLDARDKERINDLNQIKSALTQYAKDHGGLPTESSGANGDTAGNKVFRDLLSPYLNEVPVDPSGFNDETFYYYYDGSHVCGDGRVAVVIARQMDRVKNSNYDEFFKTTCGGILEGEGRSGGTESYNIIVGPAVE